MTKKRPTRAYHLIGLLCLAVLVTASLSAQCAKSGDHRESKTAGIQIIDLIITGTQSLSSGDLASLESKMIGGCYDEDSDELEERVRALFQDLGYFRAEVQGFHITPLDPLKTPKPVKLEAEVVEGARFRVKDIVFSGNHHFDSGKLRKAFPLKANDLFQRSRIAGGLQVVRQLYTTDGYLDVVMIPDITFVGSGVKMNVDVREGLQYHMGKLDVFAKKENADRLAAAWQLPEGNAYDAGYLDKFIDQNHALLPSGFSRSNVQVLSNCPDATVNVRLILDPVEAAAHPAKAKPCDASEAKP